VLHFLLRKKEKNKMGNCQSFGGSGDDAVANPGVGRGPAELLNLGREAEVYFARGGRVWYEEVSLHTSFFWQSFWVRTFWFFGKSPPPISSPHRPSV
jgi:hypothetical protein